MPRISLRLMILKNLPTRVAEIQDKLPANTEIELWWQDEARIGQKNKITRRWAKRGTRPRAAKDQRTKSAYIFGAICPARGVGAALVLPRCNTQAMQWHLDEISSQVSEGAHAILILDQAGWHTTDKLVMPSNITLLPLPPKMPELNPVETSGNSCVTTGNQTGSSIHTTRLSRSRLKPGTS